VCLGTSASLTSGDVRELARQKAVVVEHIELAPLIRHDHILVVSAHNHGAGELEREISVADEFRAKTPLHSVLFHVEFDPSGQFHGLPPTGEREDGVHRPASGLIGRPEARAVAAGTRAAERHQRRA